MDIAFHMQLSWCNADYNLDGLTWLRANPQYKGAIIFTGKGVPICGRGQNCFGLVSGGGRKILYKLDERARILFLRGQRGQKKLMMANHR